MSVPRCFKPYSCTTVAQPLIATTLTNQVVGNDLISQTVVVGDSSMFVNSDTVLMVSTGGTSTELAIQVQVVSPTSVSGIFKKNHAAGEYMVLSFPCQNIMVQGVNANPLTASLFLGVSKALPTTAGANAFHDLFLTLFYQGPAGFADCDNTANYWCVASSGSQYYLPSAVQS
jgi:hypothetical protein